MCLCETHDMFTNRLSVVAIGRYMCICRRNSQQQHCVCDSWGELPCKNNGITATPIYSMYVPIHTM